MAHQRVSLFVTTFSLFGVLNGQSYYGNSNCGGSLPSTIRVTAIPDSYYTGSGASFFGDLLDAIKAKTGIPYMITSRTDLNFGNQNADGSFSGSLIGELVANNADLVGCDLSISSAREAVVDFLEPFASYKLQLLVNSQFGLGSGVQYVAQDDADLTYLKNSKNSTLNAIYNSVNSGRPGSIVADDNGGAAKVLSGKFAYVAESNAPQRAVDANPGKLAIGGNLGNWYLALAVQQGSPLREKLNIALIQLEEEGTVDSLLAKYNLVSN